RRIKDHIVVVVDPYGRAMAAGSRIAGEGGHVCGPGLQVGGCHRAGVVHVAVGSFAGRRGVVQVGQGEVQDLVRVVMAPRGDAVAGVERGTGAPFAVLPAAIAAHVHRVGAVGRQAVHGGKGVGGGAVGHHAVVRVAHFPFVAVGRVGNAGGPGEAGAVQGRAGNGQRSGGITGRRLVHQDVVQIHVGGGAGGTRIVLEADVVHAGGAGREVNRSGVDGV